MKKYKLNKILIGGNSSKNICSDFPELPSIVVDEKNEFDRIVAIGDIHGDLDLAIDCLIVTGIIEKINSNNSDSVKLTDSVKLIYKDDSIHYYKWVAKRTVVVQVGDQVDRCRPTKHECTHPDETVNDEASDIKILFFFHDLHLLALKKGCRLFSLLGNHELLNVLGNLKYVSYKGLEEFRENDEKDLLKGRQKAFDLNSDKLAYKNKVNLANFLACSRLSAIIVKSYLFVHAGILDKLINKSISEDNNISDDLEISDEINISESITRTNYKSEFSETIKVNRKKNKVKKSLQSIEIINKTVQSWLLGAINANDNKFVNQLLAGRELSPFWPRIFGNLPSDIPLDNEICQKHVQPVLNLLDLKGLVVGHTPQLKMNINSTCSDTVWRVDVAGSQAFEKVIYLNEHNRHEIMEGRKPQGLEIILGKNGQPDKFNVLKMK